MTKHRGPGVDANIGAGSVAPGEPGSGGEPSGAPDAVLYVWKSPRTEDPTEAAALVEAWRAGDQSDPGRGPFEASTDMIWFSRELTGDAPPIWNPDAPPKAGPHPNRVVVVPLEAATLRETLEDVYGLATKYDLLVYDPQRGRIDAPMAAMSAEASAAFWPGGAIRSIVATAVAIGVAAGAWSIGIPIVSGIVIVFAVFMALIFLATIAVEGRRALTSRN